MRDLPLVARFFINMLLFCVYVVIASIIFSFLFPLILQLFGQEVLDPNNPVFARIQIFIALFVFVISMIFRKYFYILAYPREEVTSYTFENPVRYTTTKSKGKKKEVHDDSDEEIKIYVEKEIK